jgi:hypothetical protein
VVDHLEFLVENCHRFVGEFGDDLYPGAATGQGAGRFPVAPNLGGAVSNLRLGNVPGSLAGGDESRLLSVGDRLQIGSDPEAADGRGQTHSHSP